MMNILELLNASMSKIERKEYSEAKLNERKRQETMGRILITAFSLRATVASCELEFCFHSFVTQREK